MRDTVSRPCLLAFYLLLSICNREVPPYEHTSTMKIITWLPRPHNPTNMPQASHLSSTNAPCAYVDRSCPSGCTHALKPPYDNPRPGISNLPHPLADECACAAIDLFELQRPCCSLPRGRKSTFRDTFGASYSGLSASNLGRRTLSELMMGLTSGPNFDGIPSRNDRS